MNSTETNSPPARGPRPVSQTALRSGYPLAEGRRPINLAALIAGTLVAAAVLFVVALVSPAVAQNAAPTPSDAGAVASFTTRYSCCQPRVTNILRAAQLLDGIVIPPFGRFSMNAALGKRTQARGFVPAPMISGGRFVDSVGGGISQVATTLFNAAFFAGLELITHTPHSFYISRYPMGREATISWGGPELIFRNDWPTPIQLRTFASSTAITITFLGARLDRTVRAWSVSPYSFRPPRTRYVPNRSLPAGHQRVVQEAGASGFTIEHGRRVYVHGRLKRREAWRVRYEPVDRIVEISVR
jgi:vancomycin resistance protein YoaR